jgi:hypothetical protein
MIRNVLAALVASLTLGLAPFAPEPHLVGKIRWVLGGAVGMAPMDWFDLVLHGAPWLWLVTALVLTAKDKLSSSSSSSKASAA